MKRRNIAGLVLLVWLSALGWLVVRRSVGVQAGVVTREWPVPPSSAFFAVYRGGEQVGLAAITIDTVPEGLRTDELITIDLPRRGRIRRTTLRTEALYSRALHLLRWETNLLTDEGRSTRQGQITEDGNLFVLNGLGTAVETLTVTRVGDLMLPGALPFLIAEAGNRKVGGSLQARVLDPITLKIQSVRAGISAESVFVVSDSAEFDASVGHWSSVHSDTIPAWALDGVEWGLPVRRWVDQDGLVVSVQRPLGLKLDRSAFELVNTNFRAKSEGPFWDTTLAVQTTELAAAGVADTTVSAFRVVIDGAEWRGSDPAPALDGGAQHRIGDTLFMTRPTVATPANALADTVRFRSWLEPTLLIASQNGSVSLRASDIVRQERDPIRKARLLSNWVSKVIRIERRAGAQSATRTLARRAGNRGDRLTLLAALLRSQGLPARCVAGLREQDGRFLADGWVEVFADDWIPIDAETGVIPAGATRVRLMFDRPANALDLTVAAGGIDLRRIDRPPTYP
jgi:hypothetical protein